MADTDSDRHAELVRALRLLHAAINDVRDMMDDDQREQMEWRHLYAAEEAIRALEAATFCPHSLVNAENVCQMCGRENIELLQSAAHIDGSRRAEGVADDA